MDGEKSPLEMALELDQMERDVTSGEADLLEAVLPRLRAKKPIGPERAEKLQKMYEKYFGPKDAEDGRLEDEEDPDAGEDV